MSYMKEDEVYIGSKIFFRNESWLILAGQPPNGCDHLPVVEVKKPKRQGIGSLGSYKPDLVVAKNNVFLLVECKPNYHSGDAEKLLSILKDSARIELFYNEIQQRRLFNRRGIKVDLSEFEAGLWGALAHSGPAGQEEELIDLRVRSIHGDAEVLLPRNADDKLKAVFRGH